MKLSREKILRMFDGTGGSSGGSVDIDGIASESHAHSERLTSAGTAFFENKIGIKGDSGQKAQIFE